jgi:hypothetical protein
LDDFKLALRWDAATVHNIIDDQCYEVAQLVSILRFCHLREGTEEKLEERRSHVNLHLVLEGFYQH